MRGRRAPVPGRLSEWTNRDRQSVFLFSNHQPPHSPSLVILHILGQAFSTFFPTLTRYTPLCHVSSFHWELPVFFFKVSFNLTLYLFLRCVP